jgi:restriction system protein
MPEVIPAHGGYRKLVSFQTSEIIYDLTMIFCDRFVEGNKSYLSNASYRTHWSRQSDQMIQAGRSGKQNIAEGSLASGTSKKSELKLVNVARASLEELLQDYLDYLRQHGLKLWGKDSPEAKKVRSLAYTKNRSHKTYLSYMSDPEKAANCLICLINQANYLLDRQLHSLEKEFLEKGGLTERLYRARSEKRGY